MTEQEIIEKLNKQVERLQSENQSLKRVITRLEDSISNYENQRKHLQAEIKTKDAEIEKLQSDLDGIRKAYTQLRESALMYQGRHEDGVINNLRAEIERLYGLFRRLDNWQKAYPLQIFPKPTKDNLKQAAEVLKANGLSLDKISADNMRYVLNGIKDIVEQALDTEDCRRLSK